MDLKEKIEKFKYEQKISGKKISSMNFIRENYDVLQGLISEMKNQGQGSAYEKIAEFCYEEGIKTKDGKKLAVSYINDCLIKIRKEKGIRIRSSMKTRTSRKQKDELSLVYINEEVYNFGYKTLKNFFRKSVDEYNKPERHYKRIDFNEEQKELLKLYYKASPKLSYERIKTFTGFSTTVRFYEEYADLLGIKT